MPGAIVLVGSGEFTAAMDAIDRELLTASGRARPRVAILPTASWPDGEGAFLGWIERGRAHFSALGAEVEGVEIRTREDAFDEACAQAIGEADLVYLSGGRPDHLLDALAGTPAGAALRIGWRDALGLVEGAAVLPHYDAFPEPLAAAVALASPRGMAILGIDEETAAIGRDGTWQVQGRGRVTVWRGRARTRHLAGASFRLDGDPEMPPREGVSRP